MKKRLLSLVLVGTMLFSMGCGNSSNDDSAKSDTKEETKVSKVEKPENIDTSWYENDDSIIYSGLYVVGKDIAEGSYVLTVLVDDYNYGCTEVDTYESLDTYIEYKKTPTDTAREAANASNKYTTYRDWFYEGDSCALNLKTGNVLEIQGGVNTIRPAGVTEANVTQIDNSQILYPGLYNSDVLKSGTYMLTCSNPDESAIIYVFESKEDYEGYKSYERKESSDWLRAREQYVYHSGDIYEDLSLIHI